MSSLKAWLMHHEGYSDKPYVCPAGKLSIGYGRNLEDLGISRAEAEFLLDCDIERCRRELAPYPWFVNQPECVQEALLNMNYNLGISKLLNFHKMIKALVIKDYTQAALEALDSKWARQVGQRAKDIAVMIREANADLSGRHSTD